MSDPDVSLDVLVGQIARAVADIDGSVGAHYVVFGSAVLWLHGVRDQIGDVDVYVSRLVWEHLAESGWTVCTPRADDPSLLELDLAPHPSLHAFYDWTARDDWMSVQRCFDLAETVRGVRCIPLHEVARHKRSAHADFPDSPRHRKHLADVLELERRGLA